jgi:hypothetical protein
MKTSDIRVYVRKIRKRRIGDVGRRIGIENEMK